MPSSPLPSNAPPSDASAERIKKFIASREAALDKIEAEIKVEQAKLDECNDAISNLETAIPEAKEALKDQDDNLDSLIKISERFQRSERRGSLRMRGEDSTSNLYREFSKRVAVPITRSRSQIEEEIGSLRKDVRTLWDKERQMEMDLEGWKFTQRLLKDVIAHLNTHKGVTEGDIKAGKEAFRPLSRMPSQVWANVFQYFTEDAISTYLTSNSNYALRHPAYILSQVCKQWRYVVHQESGLQECAYVAPTQLWTPLEQEQVRMMNNGPQKSITILTNLYQTFAHGYNANYRYNRSSTSANASAPNLQDLLAGKEYNLFIDTHDDNASYMQRTNYLPLRNPSSLTLSVRNTIHQGHLFTYLSNFTTVNSLIIKCDRPSWLHHNSIVSLFPQLTRLEISVKRFPNFQLFGFLPATLKELYLRHDEDGTLPQLSQDVNLPKLQTLGITSMGNYLLDRLTARALRTLIIYGQSHCPRLYVPQSTKSGDIYQRIQTLRFQEWRKPNNTSGSFGAAAVLRDMSIKMKVLHNIVFDDCWVDGLIVVSTIDPSTDNPGYGKLTKVEEVTLRYPTGITRDQCEALQKLVKTVNVYV